MPRYTTGKYQKLPHSHRLLSDHAAAKLLIALVCIVWGVVCVPVVPSVVHDVSVVRELPASPLVPIWPLPQQLTRDASIGRIAVDPRLTITCVGDACALVRRAVPRYVAYMFGSHVGVAAKNLSPSSRAPLTELQIRVFAATETPLLLGVDESYAMKVDEFSARIEANTEYGALRGLESFSQLVTFDYETNSFYILGTFDVVDRPRFPWRGLLLDTSRHFLPLDTIYRILDGLSFLKMNTLHWHIVDDPSFPLESTTYPLLSEKGAYRTYATYSPADVDSIITYAKERGIRVVPEFDMPDHANSWGKGYPNIVIRCPTGDSLLDPRGTGDTYEFIGNLFREMRARFSEPFIHIGFDEVDGKCWLSDERVVEWMRAEGLRNTDEVQDYFIKRVQDIVTNLGSSSLVWQEAFKNKLQLRNDTVVMVWLDKEALTSVVRAGQRAILSYGWYLDQMVPNPPSTHYFIEDTWKDFYQNEPFEDQTLTEEEKGRILGGEASMWSEQVSADNIQSRIFPRIAAVAERLWSTVDVFFPDTATLRLDRTSCILHQRGIRSGPIMPGYCDEY
eukprot:TRINITY_DN625_c0_g1_i1.p1 TRINITY_DN625_c0_g1~~TRINITY_DN625_c0_g1_i1.p1  ORF type:complete len:562 (+),score=102.92 TRINITY_DN625_c0_g1_i1:45-1730(+)